MDHITFYQAKLDELTVNDWSVYHQHVMPYYSSLGFKELVQDPIKNGTRLHKFLSEMKNPAFHGQEYYMHVLVINLLYYVLDLKTGKIHGQAFSRGLKNISEWLGPEGPTSWVDLFGQINSYFHEDDKAMLRSPELHSFADVIENYNDNDEDDASLAHIDPSHFETSHSDKKLQFLENPTSDKKPRVLATRGPKTPTFDKKSRVLDTRSPETPISDKKPPAKKGKVDTDYWDPGHDKENSPARYHRPKTPSSTIKFKNQRLEFSLEGTDTSVLAVANKRFENDHMEVTKRLENERLESDKKLEQSHEIATKKIDNDHELDKLRLTHKFQLDIAKLQAQTPPMGSPSPFARVEHHSFERTVYRGGTHYGHHPHPGPGLLRQASQHQGNHQHSSPCLLQNQGPGLLRQASQHQGNHQHSSPGLLRPEYQHQGAQQPPPLAAATPKIRPSKVKPKPSKVKSKSSKIKPKYEKIAEISTGGGLPHRDDILLKVPTCTGTDGMHKWRKFSKNFVECQCTKGIPNPDNYRATLRLKPTALGKDGRPIEFDIEYDDANPHLCRHANGVHVKDTRL